MGKCTYRCSRCRTRNLFNKSVHAYKRPRHCRDCGYTTFYVDKERVNREPCRCAGAYFWGPHRKGCRYCIHHPEWQADRAMRDGADLEELVWDRLLGLKPHTTEEVPF